jgi:hypothetical protein
LLLVQEESLRGPTNLDAEEIVQGPQVLHGKSPA